MTATVILSQGTTFSFNSQTVAGITAITGLGSGSASEHNTTTLASTVKTFSPGLRDNGSLRLMLIRNQDDTGQLELWNGLTNQTTATCVLTLPSSTANVGTFSGFVQSMTTDVEEDGVVRGEVTIRITSAIVWS